MNQAPLPFDERTIQPLIHYVRGQKVMLDFDLAEIYGYETRYLNLQVRRNAEKFPEDFMFQLRKDEMDQILMLQNVTSSWGGTRKMPFAFTEQGIYMLMTVLKGDLATRQSISLIRLFKRMKDYINEEQNLLGRDNLGVLYAQVHRNSESIKTVEAKLEQVIANFSDPSAQRHFLILDGERIESSLAYRSIFSLAKTSVLLIDDYIGLKTLGLLKSCANNVEITIVSDNKARDGLSPQDLQDFTADTGNGISLAPNNGRVHDRYVVLDYGTKEEIVYHCGASSKDGGKKVSTMMRVENPQDYHRFIDSLFS